MLRRLVRLWGGRRLLAATMTFAFAIGFSASVSGLLVLFSEAATDEPKTVTLSDRISALTGSLQDAAAPISEIEEEVEARQALVSDLEEKQRTSEEILQLNEEQLSAVAQLFGKEITRNRSFWEKPEGTFVIALVTGLVLFAAGIAVDHWLIPRWRRRTPSEPNPSESDRQ